MNSTIGKCLCGAVEYEVSSPVKGALLCHCSECRKMSGSAFLAFSYVGAETVVMTKGEDVVSTYAKNAESIIHFCSVCGSNLFVKKPGKPEMAVYLGCLEGDLDIAIDQNLFPESKASWFSLKEPVGEHEADT